MNFFELRFFLAGVWLAELASADKLVYRYAVKFRKLDAEVYIGKHFAALPTAYVDLTYARFLCKLML